MHAFGPPAKYVHNESKCVSLGLLATRLCNLILENWIISYYLFCRNTTNNLVCSTNNYILVS